MKVTIALSTYNVAPYLRDSLERIVSQTLKDIEILCIDDASTDGTQEILRDYASKDNRIRLVEKKKNEGLSVSRNMALSLALGDYICFVDGDDLMDFDLMEEAYGLAVKKNADEVMWDYYEFGENLFKFVDKNSPSSLIGVSPNDRHSLIKRMAFTWVRLFKTSSIRNLGVHFPEGRTKQDLPVHWLTTACLKRIVLLPKRKYAYRISRTQTSSKKGKVMLDMAHVTEYAAQILKEHQVFDEYSADFYHMQLNFLKSMYDGISMDFKIDAIDKIKEIYKEIPKSILKSEYFDVRNFYQGFIERQFFPLLMFKIFQLFLVFKQQCKKML